MVYCKKSYSIEQINPITSCSEHSLNTTERNSATSTDEDLDKTKQRMKRNPFLGILYAFLSTIFMTLSSVFVKKLTYMSPGHLSLVRNAGAFAVCLPIAVYSVKEVIGPKEDRLFLLFRGFLGATALYLNLTAFKYLPLTEASIVLSTIPILTIIVAYFYLKEPCGLLHILCSMITLCGVLLSVRIPELFSSRTNTRFDSTYLGGLAAAFASVIIMTFAVVTLRKMKDLHFTVPLLYYDFLGMLENGLINYMTSSFEYPRCGWDQVLMMLIGILGFLGHCTFILAVQSEEAGIITVVATSLNIIVAMIFQIIFFDYDIDIYNIIGACLVIASVSLIGFSKWLHMLPEESRVRRKLKYLL